MRITFNLPSVFLSGLAVAVSLSGCQAQAVVFHSTDPFDPGLKSAVQAEFVAKGGITYLVGTTSLGRCYIGFYAGITGEPEDGLLLAIAAIPAAFCVDPGFGDFGGPQPSGAGATLEFAEVLGAFPPGNYPLMLWGVRSETPVVMTVPQVQEPALRLTPSADSLSVAINGFDGVRYTVERSADLKAWTVAHQQIGTNAFTLPLESGGTAWFYRLQADNIP